ncbi:zinc finger protein CONSTANS-LIKE 6-like [Euphorbia lathyris]|uniref:zinc finger protein CONSTANS-LIKE 6-like n=1 Tax=Euphorbia lathyris TaxID=212925 RepID=UPI0033134555
MINHRKTANALSGKTARACDGCSRRRARWFCVADDAFLCQSCDESVHSANQLASRHERVRLETASFKASDFSPTWHQGFTKKARTPRHNKSNQQLIKNEEKKVSLNYNNHNNPLPLVPEIGNEESNCDEDEDDLLYRVPVFDPFDAELCGNHDQIGIRNEEGRIVFDKSEDLDNLPGFLPSDMDLAEFAADVENLLGKGLDEDCNNGIKELLDCKEEEEDDEDDKFFMDVVDNKIGKVKDEQQMEEMIDCHLDQVWGTERESLLDWNFNYDSPVLTREDHEEDDKGLVAVIDDDNDNDDDAMMNVNGEKREFKKSSSLLRLDYEAIITAWASQGSPWTTGTRPDLNPDDCLPHFMDAWGKEGHYPYGGTIRGSNGAREARVLRYKEKRRNRLFSKKIRYEVRKLNAEKRPRMKGRFVKRTSFMPTAFPYINK